MADKINDEILNPNLDTIRVGDNYIMINGKEYFALNTTNVLYANSKNEAKEVFNKKKQEHHPWLILDLETGGRTYYPGCKMYATINVDMGMIKSARNDSSSTVIALGKGIRIQILERFSQGNPNWYMCKYVNEESIYEGYIRVTSVADIQYE